MILGQPSLAIPNYKKAFDLRDRVSERERLSIEGMYYLNVSGELKPGFARRSNVLLPRKILSLL